MLRQTTLFPYTAILSATTMTDQQTNPLVGETLVTLTDAAQDFGGLPIPVATVRSYVYQGAPRIELFAREITNGWTCLGTDINGKDIRAAILEEIKHAPDRT
jgi:hypothetical protein